MHLFWKKTRSLVLTVESNAKLLYWATYYIERRRVSCVPNMASTILKPVQTILAQALLTSLHQNTQKVCITRKLKSNSHTFILMISCICYTICIHILMLYILYMYVYIYLHVYIYISIEKVFQCRISTRPMSYLSLVCLLLRLLCLLSLLLYWTFCVWK